MQKPRVREREREKSGAEEPQWFVDTATVSG